MLSQTLEVEYFRRPVIPMQKLHQKVSFFLFLNNLFLDLIDQ